MPKRGQLKGTPQRRAEFIEYLRGLGPGHECVYWPWSERRIGYIRAYIHGEKTLVHHWVYGEINGHLPRQVGPGAKGVLVMHTCDNPPCCRPSHLTTGSNQQNLQDASTKGRLAVPYGSGDFREKLTDEQVVTMRRLHDVGVSQTKIAEGFGVSTSHVSRIIHKQSRRT